MEISPRKGPAPAIWVGAGLALAGFVVYAQTFSAPFVFDAAPIVTRYPSIRHLWPLWGALHPPHDGSTVEGRPILNLSLAVSYALSGIRPWAYHAMNLAIHLLAGLALFGIVRRTVRRGAGGAGDRRALGLGAVVALLWIVHPLQTESVTYIIQRAESLMGLCYLLTLYGAIRGMEEEERGNAFRRAAFTWFGFSWLACLAGMASKEVMVSAPVLVFLYDRTFVAGSFRAAWRRRPGFYLALGSTWLLLGWLAIGTGSRGGTAGLGAHLAWTDYLQTQAYALVRYLRLALWPHPLVFDYGSVVMTGAARVLPCVLVVAALAGATVFALVRRSPAGFLGAWFFAILAPTTLVPVATQTIAEHRMYLPLAAVLAGVVLGAEALGARAWAGRPPPRSWAAAGLAAGLVLAAVSGVLTLRRNAVYGSAASLWADSVMHWPGNARAHTQLGNALYLAGLVPEAAGQFQEALRLQPQGNADARYDLGNCFLQEGRLPEAIAELAEAVRLDQKNSDARNNLGNALLHEGRIGEAIAAYRDALRVDPTSAKAKANLGIAYFDSGNLLAQSGRMSEAVAQYQTALLLKPTYPEAEDNLGNALLQAGRIREAVAHYRAALRLRPDYPRAQANLDQALRQLPPASPP